MSGAVIEVLDLSRSYGEIVALNEVSFELQPGSRFVLTPGTV